MSAYPVGRKLFFSYISRSVRRRDMAMFATRGYPRQFGCSSRVCETNDG
jgi:hypothetical protein